MNPVNITFRDPRDFDYAKLLVRQFQDIGIQASDRPIRITDKGTRFELRVNLENRRDISEFIKTLREFIRKAPEVRCYLEFSGNKLRIDPLSLDRAENEMKRLSEGSFSITGSNIVVGGDNIIAPSRNWPRRKNED
jgi:hypothetical protein